MRPFSVRAALVFLFLSLFALPLLDTAVRGQTPKPEKSVGKDQTPPAVADAPPVTTMEAWGVWICIGIALLLGGTLLWAGCQPDDSHILRLGPSFIFWLGINYLIALLAIASAYITNLGDIQVMYRDPVAGLMPIAVPWFGALGAVLISLQGVFDNSKQWDPGYNFWHIGRPLFGAVVGIVSFFLILLIVNAAGSSPASVSQVNGRVFYYIVAFLVGYREETFRELLKRAVDLILKPGDAPPTPAVTFKVNGVIQAVTINCKSTPVAAAAPPVQVQIVNSGKAPLSAPRVTVTPPAAPAPANTFLLQNDQVSGTAALNAGEVRTVEVVFTPHAAAPFKGTLTVTGANLSAPRTIELSGTGT